MRPTFARWFGFTTLVTALAIAALAPSAHAQFAHTGAFRPMSETYLHPTTSTNGVTPGSPSAGRVWVDTDGNGLFNQPGDHDYDIPMAHESGLWNWRLTPSRRHIYVFGTPSSSSCSGTTVYFYRVPGTNGAPLELLVNGQCITRGIAFERFFDEPTSSQQIACIVENSDPPGTGSQRLHWVDLATGTLTTSFPPLNRVVGSVTASPTGLVAFVQSDLSDGDNLSDYSIVCLASGHLGEVFNVGGSPLSQLGPQTATAEMVDVSGDLQVRVYWPDAATVHAQLVTTGCIATPPPPPTTGACCLPNGGCMDGVTSATCGQLGGTWSGAQSLCSTANCPPPPAPDLRVELVGPPTLSPGDTLVWTIRWRNAGTLASASVTVQDEVPGSVTFLSATNGGVWNAASRRVTWTPGALGPNAGDSAHILVRTTCFATSVTNSNYSIAGTPGGTVTGPPVTTTVPSPSTAPLGVTVRSTPLAAEPLRTGDAIRHSIRVSELAGIARPYLRAQWVPGNEVSFGALVSASTGTFTVLPGGTLQWELPLAASGVDSLVFTTVVTRCRTSSRTFNILNNRGVIALQNYCGSTVASAVPADTSDLAPPSTTIEIVPLAGSPPPGPLSHRVAIARPAATMDFELRLTNSVATPETVTTSYVNLPASLVVANPPFVGTPPAGAAWDNTLRRITWSGVVPANAHVAIAFRGTLPAAGCGLTMDALGGLSGCSVGHLSAQASIITVSAPPAESLWAFTDGAFGLRAISARLPVTLRTLVCVPPALHEITTGLARTPNGDYWLLGLPTLRVNLDTAVVESFGMGTGVDLEALLGTGLIMDMARDPRDGSLVFVAHRRGTPGLRVVRWNRTSGQVSVLAEDGSPVTWGEGRHVLVDSDGTTVVETNAGLLRIPPTGSPTTWTSALLGAPPSGLARDLDGAYLTTPQNFNATGPRRLVRFDRTSGVATEVANLNSYVPSFVVWRALGVSPDQDVLVAGDNLFGELARQPTFDGDTLLRVLGGLFPADAEFVVGATTGGAGDADERPMAVSFAAPRPNPSSGPARFEFALLVRAHVKLALYDVHGREVRVLADGPFESGRHTTPWDGRDTHGRTAAAGLYFAQLDVDGVKILRKLTRAR